MRAWQIHQSNVLSSRMHAKREEGEGFLSPLELWDVDAGRWKLGRGDCLPGTGTSLENQSCMLFMTRGTITWYRQ